MNDALMPIVPLIINYMIKSSKHTQLKLKSSVIFLFTIKQSVPYFCHRNIGQQWLDRLFGYLSSCSLFSLSLPPLYLSISLSLYLSLLFPCRDIATRGFTCPESRLATCPPQFLNVLRRARMKKRVEARSRARARTPDIKTKNKYNP